MSNMTLIECDIIWSHEDSPRNLYIFVNLQVWFACHPRTVFAGNFYHLVWVVQIWWFKIKWVSHLRPMMSPIHRVMSGFSIQRVLVTCRMEEKTQLFPNLTTSEITNTWQKNDPSWPIQKQVVSVAVFDIFDRWLNTYTGKYVKVPRLL